MVGMVAIADTAAIAPLPITVPLYIRLRRCTVMVWRHSMLRPVMCLTRCCSLTTDQAAVIDTMMVEVMDGGVESAVPMNGATVGRIMGRVARGAGAATGAMVAMRLID